MRQPLSSGLLDHAREPMTLLVREDWVWRGEQAVDGVFAARNDSAEPNWRAALAPHLAHAQSILESNDAAIILFRDPQIIDCDLLGSALPLKKLSGALSSFPFKAPQSEHLKVDVDDALLIMRHGTVQRSDMRRFQPANLRNWYDSSSLTVEAGTAPPRRPGVPGVMALKTAGEQLFEPTYSDAGLQDLRIAIEQLPERGPWADRVAPILGPLAAALAILILAVFAIHGPASASGMAVLLTVAIVGFVLVRMLFTREPAQTAQDQPPARVPVAPNRPAGRGRISAIVVLGALIAVAASTGWISGAASPISFVVLAAVVIWLLLWLRAHLGRSGSGAATGRARADVDQSQAQTRYQKGTLRRLFERLLQKTPLADLARTKFDRRVAELKRLFDEGRTEEALKKGLALGGPQPPNTETHADAPISGPGIRERLEIQAAHGARTHFLAALPPGAREELEALYRQHAQQCIANGDFKHAAFIHAELLDDAEAAVKVFSDAGQFAVAAKLAQGRRLSPALFIPLWYRAGEHERALRLAERHDAYELLLQLSDPADAEFHSLVRHAWSERLAAVGDYVTALAVSEPLLGKDNAIKAKRHDWIVQGLTATPSEAEIIARATKALDVEAGNATDLAMTAFGQLLQEDNIDAARRRKRLAELLLMPDFEANIVADFRSRRLPRIADQLPRALLIDHAEYGLLNAHQPLSSLADAGGQTTLAADIRHLPPAAKSRVPNTNRHLAVGPRRGARGVVAAAPMRGGRFLVAYEDGSLQLFNARNEEVWRDQLWNPRDIIPIEPGRFAIVIRQESNERKLSVVDTETLGHADIGPLDLEVWAATAASHGWLVYANKHVLNLRLDQLLAPLSGESLETLEYHWSTPITIDGRMRALCHADDSGDALWLFERSDHVLERWCVSRDDLSISYRALSFPAPAREPTITRDFSWFALVEAGGRKAYLGFTYVAPDRADKAEAAFPKFHVQTGKRRPGQHDCLPMAAVTAGQSGIALVNSDQQAALRLSFEGANDISMRHSFAGDVVLLWDDAGRIIKLATETAEVEFANVAVAEGSAAPEPTA